MSFKTRFTQFYADLANVDIDELDNVYHEQILFKDPIASHSGIESVKAYFAHLLDSTSSCKFDIHHFFENASGDSPYDFTVEWTMHLTLNNQSSSISVNGVSLLTLKDDRVVYHRDYYDMGEMVYEHGPILGFVIKKIKGKLAS